MSSVHFSGLTIDRRLAAFGRKERRNIPTTWDRVEFVAEWRGGDPTARIDQWIAENIDGRWGLYAVAIEHERWRVVAFFEDEFAAVMFRLKGGETEWAESI